MNIDLSLSASGTLATNTPDSRGISSNDQVEISSKSSPVLVDNKANDTTAQTDRNVAESRASIKNVDDGKQQAPLQRQQLEDMAEKLQQFVGSLNKGLEFSVDKDSGRDVIKVIDRDSKEVIRQYPSEEVLDLIANLSDAAGNFVNSKA